VEERGDGAVEHVVTGDRTAWTHHHTFPRPILFAGLDGPRADVIEGVEKLEAFAFSLFEIGPEARARQSSSSR
jgi:hypothetical protein